MGTLRRAAVRCHFLQKGTARLVSKLVACIATVLGPAACMWGHVEETHRVRGEGYEPGKAEPHLQGVNSLAVLLIVHEVLQHSRNLVRIRIHFSLRLEYIQENPSYHSILDPKTQPQSA